MMREAAFRRGARQATVVARQAVAVRQAPTTTHTLRTCLRPQSRCLVSTSSALDGYSAGGDDGHELSTHVSSDGSTPRMVDVSCKVPTRRTATARSRVRLPTEITDRIKIVGGEVVGTKGPVGVTAAVAGLQAAKRTSDLIPFCHPLPIEDCQVGVKLLNEAGDGGAFIQVDCTVLVTHKTGVEMEAMMGASVGALVVYDMLKGLSHDIVIEETMLISKTGGKRDFLRQGGDGGAKEQ